MGAILTHGEHRSLTPCRQVPWAEATTQDRILDLVADLEREHRPRNFDEEIDELLLSAQSANGTAHSQRMAELGDG